MKLILTPLEAAMLKEMVESRIEEGSYYGNPTEYEQRIKALRAKIQVAIDKGD